MEHMPAARQQPDHLIFFYHAQTNCALSTATIAFIIAGVAHSSERERGQGGDSRWVEPGLGGLVARGAGGGDPNTKKADRSVAAGEAVAAEDVARVEVEEGDEGDDEEEAEYGRHKNPGI